MLKCLFTFYVRCILSNSINPLIIEYYYRCAVHNNSKLKLVECMDIVNFSVFNLLLLLHNGKKEVCVVGEKKKKINR